ncbi:MAG: FecCD family ABC transporter permease [Thermoproteus sp.]
MRVGLYLAASATALILLFFYSLAIGIAHMSPLDVLASAASQGPEGLIARIRLARAVTAVAVGAALAAAGAALQSALRNPLASPFTLGIPQAAAVGVALALFLGGAGAVSRGFITVSNPYFVISMAFAAAFSNALLVLLLASMGGFSLSAIILAMIAVSSIYQAALALLQYLFLNDLQTAAVVFWTFGDVGRPSLEESYLLLAVSAATLAYFWLRSVDYNLMAAGDEIAKASGVNPRRLRLETLLASSASVAVLVSFTGVIGFVGLAAPNMARLAIGGDHKALFPASALTGSWLLLAADVVGRLVKPPVIIPVGITMSFIGSLWIIALLLQARKRGEAW